MTVWITRTRPGADQTAARLEALGIRSLVDPLLEVWPLQAVIDLGGFDALAFTSPNGVAAFARLSDDRSLPAFAVGLATAEALREIGISRIDTADGDLPALVDLLASRQPGHVLALTPTEPSGDFAALAAAQGASVQTLAIYETIERWPTVALTSGDLKAVLIHSAKAGRALARMPAERLTELAVVALSEACAAPLRGLPARSIAVAPFPDDASLARLTLKTLSDAP